jgi:site-specific DNA-methyltransferase (adenine-specific)
MKGQSQLFSSESDEWRTPADLFDKLNDKFSFDCDVAATNENALCSTWYTKENNGLINTWGKRNWCNPPYSQIKDWVFKAHQEAIDGNLTVMLIPARTCTTWFHEIIYKRYHVEFIRGRLKFSDSKNSAPFPSMLVYFGISA